jgi:hypothetical protein
LVGFGNGQSPDQCDRERIARQASLQSIRDVGGSETGRAETVVPGGSVWLCYRCCNENPVEPSLDILARVALEVLVEDGLAAAEGVPLVLDAERNDRVLQVGNSLP